MEFDSQQVPGDFFSGPCEYSRAPRVGSRIAKEVQMAKARWLLILVALLGFQACGGGQPSMDKESIRRNADDADRDLDRESRKNQD
jgi:hypothetical protein